MISLSFFSPIPHNKPDQELLFSSPVADSLGDIDYIFNMPVVLKKGSIISVVGKTTVEIIELFKCTQRVP